MRLSLLDRSRTRAGAHEGAGLHHTVERAVGAEELGYDRFWVAEHHAVPGIASGSPAVLLAAIGARTTSIRLGSGGVMLPNHPPLVVAEQFLMLAGLHPDRVDLGVGRSTGFTAPVRRALRAVPDSSEAFAEDVAELRGYLERTGAVTARPVPDERIPLFLLASGQGIETAARLGLPVVVGGPVLSEPDIAERLAAYRREFTPHRGGAPRVTISLDILVADTDREARELALPEVWALVRSRRTGTFDALESPARIRAARWEEQDRRRVEVGLAAAVAGSVATVGRRVEQLVEQLDADEVLASGSTYDRAALAASDAAIAHMLT